MKKSSKSNPNVRPLFFGIHLLVYLYNLYVYSSAGYMIQTQSNLASWLLEASGDRMVLIWLNGLSISFLSISCMDRMLDNPLIDLRSGNRKAVIRRYRKKSTLCLLQYVLFDSFLVLLMGLFCGFPLPDRGKEVAKLFVLWTNKLIFCFILERICYLGYRKKRRSIWAYIFVFIFLIANFGMTLSTAFRGTILGRSSIVGWIVPVSFTQGIIGSFILAVFLFFLEVAIFSYEGAFSEEKKKVCKEIIGIFLLTFGIWSVYWGIIFPREIEEPTNIVAGFLASICFQRIGSSYLFYVFLTSPILGICFNRFAEKTGCFGICAAMRTGSYRIYWWKVYFETIGLFVIYYLAGISLGNLWFKNQLMEFQICFGFILQQILLLSIILIIRQFTGLKNVSFWFIYFGSSFLMMTVVKVQAFFLGGVGTICEVVLWAGLLILTRGVIMKNDRI